jgi:hypothetical protein
MIIHGCFIGNAPYFIAHLRSPHFHGNVWFLADTGASNTTLLDRSVKLLGISEDILEPDPYLVVGIGGSMCSLLVRDVELTMASDEGDFVFKQNLGVIKHDLNNMSLEESARILRIPSVLGRDLISQFQFIYDYKSRVVELRR